MVPGLAVHVDIPHTSVGHATQPPRRHSSQVRDEQARRTRGAIVTATHDLFLAQGYAATTIDGIAEAAHVIRRTAFNSAGGKVALLKLALDWAVVGDDEPIALADRPAIKAILAESHPRKALMLWVQTVTDVVARTTPLGEVFIAAADIDPAATHLLAEASRNRMLDATAFIRYLASLDGLAAPVGLVEGVAAAREFLLGVVRRRSTRRRWHYSHRSSVSSGSESTGAGAPGSAATACSRRLKPASSSSGLR